MASYRPFPPPPQSTFGPPPTQNSVPPQPGGNQYPQNWGYNGGDSSFNSQNYNQMRPGPGYQQGGYGTSTSRNQHPPLPPPNHQQQQPQYPYPMPPPPPESSYPPPPLPSIPQNGLNIPPAPAQMYYQSSQFSQFNHQPLQPAQPPPPPPPPSSPPPSSSIPPPPPSSPPPPPPSTAPTADQTKGSRPDGENRASNNAPGSTWHDPGPSNKGLPSKHQKHHGAPMPPKKSNGPPTKVETEDERRLRKKREFEKQRQEEKRRQQLKESQKTQTLPSGVKGHGSISGSRMGERRANPLLSGERTENRLKKPTTFLCKLKFQNELPDPTAQPKLLSLRGDKDRFTEYAITSLEKMHKPQLYVEPDLGIPLDLLDLSVYNPPKGRRLALDPEDAALLQDDTPVTPQKKDGIKTKSRPEDVGFSWLVKTQYISPLSMEGTKQSLSVKQAKEMREGRGGHLLDNLNNRERRIQNIEASFEACKSRPVHSTNKMLRPVEILPLLPDLDRYDDQFVVATFDGAPTADSEIYGKLDPADRDVLESRAVMKSYAATGLDSGEQEKFLAYMAPLPDEKDKDIYDEDEDVSFSWVREYSWKVHADPDDPDDPTTYLVAFGESEAHYVPLPTRLLLKKKRAKEGKAGDEIVHFPAPSRITVRRRDTAAVIGLRERENEVPAKRRRVEMDDRDGGRHQKDVGEEDMYPSSGGEAEYDMSD